MDNQTQEALKMAIEDLELCNGAQTVEDVIIYTHEAIQACKEALEQPAQEPAYQVGEIVNPYGSNIKIKQPAQEPVAWLYKRENSSGGWYVVTNYEKENDNGTRNIECYDIPLYTHPAPSWQGLSDDELDEFPYWDSIAFEYRIKPTPEQAEEERIRKMAERALAIPEISDAVDRLFEAFKEPQYLYFHVNDADEITFETEKDTFGIDNDLVTYIGKIKLEVDDE